MAMVRLFLDDERDPREWLPNTRWFRGRDLAGLDEWIWAKAVPQAIAILQASYVDEVSLDHDLGEGEGVGTGYDVLRFIEERVALDDTYIAPLIHIHTSNLGARDRMELGVQGIANLISRREGGS
jgi:sirohydrochlorin ferrochelatase